MTVSKKNQQSLKIRITHDNVVVMGPGKADLLDAIDQCGSISSAAKHMQMSYKRAWDLVHIINKSFNQPLVISASGGQHGGGAKLTEFGRSILASYRDMVAKTYMNSSLEINNILSNLTQAE